MRLAVGLARQPAADLTRQLDRLEREIERLDGLISQVLKLARLHGTDAPFARELFDVDEVIYEVVRDANFEGAAKGCTVDVIGAAKCSINGNRELVRSAIENVLRNAVRYSPQDGRVEVSVEHGGMGLVLSDSRPRPGRARQRLGAYIRAVLPCRRIARPRFGRGRHRVGHHFPGHESAWGIRQSRQSRRRRLRGPPDIAAFGAGGMTAGGGPSGETH